MKVLAFPKRSYLKSLYKEQFIRKCLPIRLIGTYSIYDHLQGFADEHIDQSQWSAAKTRYGTGR